MTKRQQPIFLRLTAEDMARLEAIAEHIALPSHSTLARTVMRIGLAAIEEDPTVLLDSLAKRFASFKRRSQRAKVSRRRKKYGV